jgi:SAM-dependent methyltransferase
MSGNPAQLYDYVDLLLLQLAKIRRRKLSASVSQEEFYNDFFTEDDAEVLESTRDPRRRYRGEILRKAVWDRARAGMIIADIGCGTGDNLSYIHGEGVQFFGIEYAEASARIARSTLDNRATISVGSATRIPYPDSSVDIALCIEVVEHIEEEDLAFREIARVIRPGGWLVLSLPYRHWFASYKPLMGHFRHYTKADVEGLLDRNGFEIEEYLANFPRWSRMANYIYVICRLYCLAMRIVGIRQNATVARLPFTRVRMIDALFAKIEGLRRQEMKVDYADLSTSTFVVAKKALEKSCLTR